MNNLYNSVKSFLRINTDVENRLYGFKDACSRLVEQEEQIQLPAGFEWDASSAKQSNLESPAASFAGSIQQEDGAIILQQKLSLNKRVYNASDWEGFRGAVKEFKTYGDYLVIKKK